MTVYVCPEKDIECGDRAGLWCVNCPKRKAQTPVMPESVKEAAQVNAAVNLAMSRSQTVVMPELPNPFFVWRQLDDPPIDCYSAAQLHAYAAQYAAAQNAALIAERDQLRERVAELERDAVRLECYLMGSCLHSETHRNAILNCEIRSINGDKPSLDEWRAAIDAAIAAKANPNA